MPPSASSVKSVALPASALLAVPPFRPTLGMDGAKHLLDLSEDEVISLIDQGLLSHAWNIGLGARREIRLLRRCIDAYAAWCANPRTGRRGLPDTGSIANDAVIHLSLLPPGHDKPFLTNGQIQRALNCVSDHVLNLIAAKELAQLPDTKFGRGPAGSALVTLASFQQFLKSRRL